MGFLRSLFGGHDRSKTDSTIRPLSQRLEEPDMAALEAAFGSVCVPLRELYANREEILRQHATRIPSPEATEDQYIYACWYQPADQQSLDERWPANEKLFEFANDGSGNAYVVDPACEDPEILFYDHEEELHSGTGVLLSEYLQLPEAPDS